MAEVVLRDVSKSFGASKVIRGVDLRIEHGEFVVFVGPSGCGKSTLLRLIAGLEDITAGELLIDGSVVNDRLPKERGVAMVFQSYALYPHMTAYDNMAFGLELSKLSRPDIDRRVRHVARLLQIESLLERKPRDLSGGQRQRVAIGRAIVREPKIFLFDEPLSNLDAALRVQTRIEIARLHQQTGATMIYVTHDQVEAMTLAQKIVVLNAGRIEQIGAPLELYHHPSNLFVARFIGSPQMNLWPSQVLAIEANSVSFKTPGGGVLSTQVTPGGIAAGDPVTIGIRPEHVQVSSRDEGAVHGRIELVEHLGESELVYVQADDLIVAVRIAAHEEYRSGQAISLALPADKCHVFDKAGSRVNARS
jgi:multiple sugar transport system ATP-binding protein